MRVLVVQEVRSKNDDACVMELHGNNRYVQSGVLSWKIWSKDMRKRRSYVKNGAKQCNYVVFGAKICDKKSRNINCVINGVVGKKFIH